MPAASGLKIGFYVLAAALLGAATTPASFAEEVAAHAVGYGMGYGMGHGFPTRNTAPGFAGHVSGRLGSPTGPGAAPAAPNAVRPNPSPVVVTAAATRGKINGTALIRPALAPSGLGGPAKAVVGINGSAFRSKH
jgi:hypothetical protein